MAKFLHGTAQSVNAAWNMGAPRLQNFG